MGQMELPYGTDKTKPLPAPPEPKGARKATRRAARKSSRKSAEAATLPLMDRHVIDAPEVHKPSVTRRRPIPPRLYRMGEVVEYSGKSRQTVHNYTTMGLLPEREWTKGGHRLYDESVFERLDLIEELKAEDRSLEEIREYFTRGR